MKEKIVTWGLVVLCVTVVVVFIALFGCREIPQDPVEVKQYTYEETIRLPEDVYGPLWINWVEESDVAKTLSSFWAGLPEGVSDIQCDPHPWLKSIRVDGTEPDTLKAASAKLAPVVVLRRVFFYLNQNAEQAGHSCDPMTVLIRAEEYWGKVGLVQ